MPFLKLLVFVPSCWLASTSVALAGSFAFTKVADTSTPIPGGTGRFTSIDPFYFSESGGAIAFVASGDSAQRGVYSTAGGSLQRIADTTTVVPGGTGNAFADFFAPWASGDQVLFRGFDPARGAGLYLASGGSLSVVVDPNRVLPDGVPFGGTPAFALAGGEVAFIAGHPGGDAVYLASGGSISTLAGTSTPIPGGSGNFGTFNFLKLSDQAMAFVGYSGSSSLDFGIYVDRGSGLTVVADTHTPIAGGTDRFAGFVEPSISGDVVAFSGSRLNAGPGVFVSSGGALEIIADTSTPVPGGSGQFLDFFATSIARDGVLFQGLDANSQMGLYLGDLAGGPITKVIAAGDRLEGKTISFLALPQNRDSALVFLANFDDGSQGLYSAVSSAAVPEPSSFALMLGGIVLVALADRWWGRREPAAG